MELRDGDLSSGSVKVEVRRHGGSQQSLQNVMVKQLSDTSQPGVFILTILVLHTAHHHYNYLLIYILHLLD